MTKGIAKASPKEYSLGMSATDILEEIRRMPTEEQQKVAEKIWTEFGEFDAELTPEETVELDRRAEAALNQPTRGKRAEDVFIAIEDRLRGKK